jgi:hypothetical protein
VTEEREIYQSQGQNTEGAEPAPVTDPPAPEENRDQSKEPTREQKREGNKPDYPPRVPNTRNFRRIQKLLYAYPGTNLAIKNLESQLRQIDNEMVRSGVANYNIGSGGSISSGDIEVLSGPEADTEKRLRNKKRLADKINVLRARAEAIRAAVNQLGDREGRIIRTKYFQNWEAKNPGARIWRELEMKWDTYLIRLCKSLEFVGRYIGEWNDREDNKEDRAAVRTEEAKKDKEKESEATKE